MMIRVGSLVAACTLGLWLGMPGPVHAQEQAGAEAGLDSAELPLEQLRTLSEVFSRIRGDYVDVVRNADLIEAAIDGMVNGLDPHSSYLDPEELEDLRAGTQGRFGGLGMEVGEADGFIRVIAPIDDTPAAEAGVQAGDLIIRIDGESTQGMPLAEAVRRLRGAPGEPVDLVLVREGQEGTIEVTLIRDVIRVRSVRARLLEPGFGYVRISQFQSQTGAALIDAVDLLLADNGGALQGLILDLRNNPGGVLPAAISVSDAFLTDGVIVETRGRLPDSEMRFHANPDDILDGAPLVVIINAGSASASEIVAGALQDQKRAILVGQRSFGKGSVQSILPLHNGAALKLTTARYYTPSGRSIQASGIEPDVIIDELRVTSSDSEERRTIREVDLNRHLEAEEGDLTDRAGPEVSLAVSDYVLFEAFNLLKGMAIINRR